MALAGWHLPTGPAGIDRQHAERRIPISAQSIERLMSLLEADG